MTESIGHHAFPVKKYARIAGILFIVSMIAGAFGEMIIPSRMIVQGDAAATAANILRSESLFRIGFSLYLVEAIGDIALIWIMYQLLKPVHQPLALLSVCFGLISTATFAGAELFYFGALQILKATYLGSFTPEQVNSLAMLSLRFYGFGAGIFMVFYGIATGIRGYLIYRSGYLPRTLGVLFMLGGAGFIVRCIFFVLKPVYASDILLAPTAVAGLAFTIWVLAKGVDEQKWALQTR